MVFSSCVDVPVRSLGLALIGKYGGDVKATEAAAALLPLPSRERGLG
jgi:hypothetical protein